MISVTPAFLQELANDNRAYKEYADITLVGGTVLHLTNENFWQNGFSYEDATSSDDEFQVGSAIVNTASLVINNLYEDFSQYDFYGAKVVLRIGLEVNGSVENFIRGTYIADRPSQDGYIIKLTLYDYMSKFDLPYSESRLGYPATLAEIVRNACTVCGVTLNTTTFPHSTFRIQQRPDDETTTFREVISWVAQIAGCYARCDTRGRLQLKWYDQDALASLRGNLDGGVFDNASPSSYTTGDNADGGSFNPWDLGYVFNSDGGTGDADVHNIYSIYSESKAMDDTVITGVAVAPKDDPSAEVFRGSAGYVLKIQDNGFITKEYSDVAGRVCEWLATQLIGLQFRKLQISHASNPTIEAGDIAVMWDRKGRSYPFIVTRTRFSVGSAQQSACGSETPLRNSAARFSAETKNYLELRKQIANEKTDREIALEELANELAESSGLYSTVINNGQVDPSTGQTVSGGSIYYLHDMPNLVNPTTGDIESKVVWKMTASAWGVTTNYQGTRTRWNAGMTVDGDTVVRLLSAEGVNADWITTGTIRSQDGSVSINLTTGAINIKGVTSFSNYVTKTNLSTAGQTTINGANITTGTIKDSGGNTQFNLSTGELTMKKGSINIGSGNFVVDTTGNLTMKKGSINLGSGNFIVTNTGDVTIKKGSINIGNGSFIVDSSGNLTATKANISGTITSKIGSQSLIISEAFLTGKYSNTIYGKLDLCAEYSGGKHHVALWARDTLHLQFNGTGDGAFSIEKKSASTSSAPTSVLWRNSAGNFIIGAATYDGIIPVSNTSLCFNASGGKLYFKYGGSSTWYQLN